MRPLPAYRIEPPDVISIEMLKLVPLPPYRAEIYDVFEIRAKTPPDQPIDNYYMVEADGTIDLGPPYGTVRVAGMTIDEMTAAVNKSLGQLLRDPAAYVQLARVAGAQPVTGQYLVGSGRNDQSAAIRHGADRRQDGDRGPHRHPEPLEASSSTRPKSRSTSWPTTARSYYVITQGAGLGDNVRRLPFTGNETVLDAISQINGLSQVSSKNIWIVRPSAADREKANILPVDWDGITRRGATATNYQLFPGDRLYIGEDPLITRTNLLAKKTAPIERLMGILELDQFHPQRFEQPFLRPTLRCWTLVRKGAFTSDEEFKGILLKAAAPRPGKRRRRASRADDPATRH